MLAETRHPVSLVTKNALVERDLDLLAPMARAGWSACTSRSPRSTTDLAASMEPRASAPHARLRAMRALAEAGVPVGVMVAPVIPMINDRELEHILEAARDARRALAPATCCCACRTSSSDLFREWLELHYPDRAAHVMSLIQQMRGGKDYDSRSARACAAKGRSPQLIEQRFRKAHARLGFGPCRRWTRAGSCRRASLAAGRVVLNAAGSS